MSEKFVKIIKNDFISPISPPSEILNVCNESNYLSKKEKYIQLKMIFFRNSIRKSIKFLQGRIKLIKFIQHLLYY